MNKNELLQNLEDARLKYKPKLIKILIIAEAAPDSLERFFYYEDVKEKDFLFLALSEYFYPELKELFLFNNRDKRIKTEILNKFREDGFFLIDLYELPTSLNHESESESVKKLIMKVDNLINYETPIITIKANVYDALKFKLGEFNHIDVRIPFPSSGQQNNFKIKFEEAIKKANL